MNLYESVGVIVWDFRTERVSRERDMVDQVSNVQEGA